MFERFLRWLAMADAMPRHEDVSGEEAREIDRRFKEVTKDLGRQTWSFSVDASRRLRRWKGE